jgi:hypothetical protein
LEEHQARAVFHKKTRDVGKHAVLIFIRTAAFSVIADFGALHAQDFRVKLDRSFEIIARQSDVIYLFDLHLARSSLLIFVYCKCAGGFK